MEFPNHLIATNRSTWDSAGFNLTIRNIQPSSLRDEFEAYLEMADWPDFGIDLEERFWCFFVLTRGFSRPSFELLPSVVFAAAQ